jgi:diguanylate cyclase (GGDEF)-like protein/PAS domain S-box-containing protein
VDTAGYDPAAIDAAFDWLTGRHPTAPVCAVGPDGLMVELPECFDAGRHVLLRGRSPLDFVAAPDAVHVVATWERVRTQGMARVVVGLISGERATMHCFDLRHRYGVFVIVVAPTDAADPAALLDGQTDLSHLPPRICRLNRDEVAVVVDADAAALSVLGWPREALVGRRSIELVHPDDVERAIANWMAMLEAPGQPVRWRGRYARADGSWLWLDITNTNRLGDPDHGDVVSEMVDIADEMAAHEALRERERLLRRLTEALPSGVVQFDLGRRVLHANEQFSAIVGGDTVEALLDAVVDDDRALIHAALDAVLRGGADANLEVHLSGDRVCRVALRALTDEHGVVSGGLICVDDVTEAARLRQQLELRATFDGLTSCFSRSSILAAMADLGTREPGTGVVFVDLDRFKQVNDELGHGAGDELLAAIGDRLRRAVRDVDLVGRVGGDEFLVLCPGAESLEAVDAIGRRITEAVSEPLVLGGEHPVVPRVSIGTAWAPAGADLSVLVTDADAAMYAAKRAR